MKILLSENLSLEINDDVYLTKVTGKNHFKFVFSSKNFILNNKILDSFKEIINRLNGVIFTEFLGDDYELSKLVQKTGFIFDCASMIWISTKSADKPELLPGFSNCKIINIAQFAKYKDKIQEIAATFDTSHFESFNLYKPYVRKMYQDKAISQWQENKEIILYFRDDNPIAFSTFSINNKESWFLHACVDPLYRNSPAYYSMILKGQRYLLNEKKVKSVKLGCLASNIIVQKVWNELNFKPYYSTVIFNYGVDI